MSANQNGDLRIRRGMAGSPEAPDLWRLKLYVTDQTPRTLAAIANLKRICEEYVTGRYTIEVIDLLESPQLARGEEIFAIPTLVRQLPEPVRRVIGDLSDTQRGLVGLQIVPGARRHHATVTPKDRKGGQFEFANEPPPAMGPGVEGFSVLSGGSPAPLAEGCAVRTPETGSSPGE